MDVTNIQSTFQIGILRKALDQQLNQVQQLLSSLPHQPTTPSIEIGKGQSIDFYS